MVKDRLADLKAAQSKSVISNDNVQINMDSNESKYLTDFFGQVEDVKSSQNKIRRNVAEIKQLQTTILASPTNDSNSRNLLDERMNETKTVALNVKQRLKEMTETQALQKQGTASDRRIRKNQLELLSNDYVSLMRDFSSVQVEYRDNCKKHIQRQLEIIGKPTDDEEIERMMESGQLQIYDEGAGAQTALARKTLAEVEARHREIQKVTRDIELINEMFSDLAMFVESQREVVDNIDVHVEEVDQTAKQAKDDLKRANEFNKSARKKKIIIIIIIVVVVIIIIAILAILLAVYLPKK